MEMLNGSIKGFRLSPKEGFCFSVEALRTLAKCIKLLTTGGSMGSFAEISSWDARMKLLALTSWASPKTAVRGTVRSCFQRSPNGSTINLGAWLHCTSCFGVGKYIRPNLCYNYWKESHQRYPQQWELLPLQKQSLVEGKHEQGSLT